MSYNTELQSNNDNLQDILDMINSLPEAVEQAIPVISVNSTNGLITATAGNKSTTHQLPTQAEATITPNNFTQYAVSSGQYTTGDVIVLGDSDLIAENIKKGVDIFGVTGTYEGSGGSGGGDTSVEDGLITRTVSACTNSRVTSIGSYAFIYCSSLTSVSFPNVTSIGSSAFTNCYNLTSVSFPNVTSIGDCAFFSCSGLTSVSFPSATSIGSSAFTSCSSLTSVSFPNVTSIGNEAFTQCSSLTSVNFPNVTSIGSYAFTYCRSLTSVSFPSATSIGSYAFIYCSSLTSVSFPNVTSIGSSAFTNCYNLTSVSFPNVTSIGDYAFYNCYNLTSVSFPKVTSIGNCAFRSCYNLKSLYLTGSSLCKLSNSNAFSSTPIGGYSTSAGTYGSIYVPTSLLTSYKAAANWKYLSSRFVGI